MENSRRWPNPLKKVISFKMKHQEKFATLCHMHLSFLLDLKNQEFSVLLEQKDITKAKTKNFAYFSKKNKEKNIMNGASLTQEGVCQIYQIIEYLGQDFNVCEEGLFRKNGSALRKQELKSLLNSGTTVDLYAGYFSVHDCASVLKIFLSELQEPLLTEAHFQAHCQVSEMCEKDINPDQLERAQQRQLKTLQLLFLLLPPENFLLLKDLLNLLNKVSTARTDNCMNASSLAKLFAPHILCPRKMSPEGFQDNFESMVKSVEFMIENASQLFNPPSELVNDIQQYCNQFSKKNVNNKENLESEAVNTIITFCDRSKCKEENPANYTAKALAELHSYVQSLPDSVEKKKLIRKFNKGNYNTPVKSQKKHARSKSVGSSIKQHLHRKRRQEDIYKVLPRRNSNDGTQVKLMSQKLQTSPCTSQLLFQDLQVSQISLDSNDSVLSENQRQNESSAQNMFVPKLKKFGSPLRKSGLKFLKKFGQD